MKNPATQPIPEWNEFTEYLRDNPGALVRLRSGVYVKPVYYSGLNEFDKDKFTYELDEQTLRWKTNGKSFEATHLDMMEIER